MTNASMRYRPTKREYSLHPCHNGQPLDPLIPVGIQKRIVVLERNAAVGIAVRAEHVGMREQTGASEDRVLAADRGQPQRRYPVKQRLARRQLVNMRRRRAEHSDADVTRIVELAAE